MRAPVRGTALLAFLFSAACGGSDGGGGGSAGPCDTDPPAPECGGECTVSDDCDDGFHCGEDGTCTAECSQDDSGCDDGDECDDRGYCVEGGDGCAEIHVDLAPVTPTVMLLIDRSGSMVTNSFGGFDTRWDAVEDALTNDTTGVLWDVDDDIIVGASLYMSDTDINGCPLLETVTASAMNADGVAELIADNPPYKDDLNTPTAESVTATVADFPAGDNRVLILATDGDPDTCEDPDSNGQQGPRTGSENAVAAAFDDGIPTFVLSVGDDATETHLERLARAGRGQDLDTGTATPYIANNPDELVDAFGEIIAGVRSCQISVDGTVDLDRANEGDVVLNGDPLTYGTDWTMEDEDTMVLLGGACDTYLETEEVTLDATFPCGGVVVVD